MLKAENFSLACCLLLTRLQTWFVFPLSSFMSSFCFRFYSGSRVPHCVVIPLPSLFCSVTVSHSPWLSWPWQSWEILARYPVKCPEGSIQTGHLRLEGFLNLVALSGDLFFLIYIELATILPLFYVLVYWPWCMWDLNSPTRDWTHMPCIGRWSLNHWTTREVPCEISNSHLFKQKLLPPPTSWNCMLDPLMKATRERWGGSTPILGPWTWQEALPFYPGLPMYLGTVMWEINFYHI